MKVVVVGCGRVGSTLAYQLFQKGHQVTVVDQLAAAFENLPADFGGRTVEGDVLDQDVLRRAGLTEAEGLAAVTNVDSVNAVVAYVARTVYNLPNVVVRNYDPRWRLVYEAFALQLVSSASWSAQRIEELLSESALRAVFSAGNAEVQIYEMAVPAGWEGHRLQELLPEGTCLTVALARAGRAVLPGGNTLLEAGDIVYLSSTLEGVEAIRRRLENPAPRLPGAPAIPLPAEALAAPEVRVAPCEPSADTGAAKAQGAFPTAEPAPEAAPAVLVVPETPVAMPGGRETPAEAAAPEEE